MTSSTTSTPSGTAATASSHAVGGRSTAQSAPSSRQRSSLPAEQVTTTWAPMALAHLDGSRADAGRAGVHQSRSPRRQAALQHQRIEGRDPDLGDGGGVGQLHGGRHGHELALVHPDPLGVGPAADDGHDVITVGDVAHPLAPRDHGAGQLQPGDLVLHRRPGIQPTRCSRSARLTAVARPATNTSSGPGSGSGTSLTSRTSGPP